MEEIWKNVVGYEGLYQVSNLGRIKSLDKIDTLGRKIKSKILKLSNHKDGYLQLCLYKNGIQKKKLIHRLVAEAFIINAENKPQVNHKDGNKTNNSIENLEWVTDKENARHAWETGLQKITEEQKTKMRVHKKGKRVLCIDNGVVYKSTLEAERMLNLTYGTVSSGCRGVRKRIGGYRFKYI